MARLGEARILILINSSATRRGKVWRGVAGHGEARLGTAWRGLARRGVAWHGGAWLGSARQGEDLI